MEFLYPNILYGLFAIAIPILVHLFNFRRYKKVYFSNVQMLKSIHKKTKKQSEVKHLIILLLRILTIIAVVLAFAHPIIPNNDSKIDAQEHQYISIYIDNSFSMTHIGENGTLLNEAQNMAMSILDSYENGDYFHLITNDMLGHHHRWFNKMEMTQNVMEVEAVHLQQSLTDIMQREAMLRDDITTKNKAILYVLSDFQKNLKLLPQMAKDTNLLVRAIPLQNNPVNNISVDSIWFQYQVQLPHAVSVVNVKVSNSGDKKQKDIPLRLTINDVQKAVVSVDLDASKSQVFNLSFTNESVGNFIGKIEIDDYPIVFDDQFYFTFKVRDVFTAASIYQNKPNPYLHHLFANDSLVYFSSYSVNAVNYQELKRQDLIILNEIEDFSSGLKKELEQYVKGGGQVLLIPSSGGDITELNRWLKKMDAPVFGSIDTVALRMDDIDKQQVFFNRVFDKQLKKKESNQKVDLPFVLKHFPVLTNGQASNLLKTQGGSTLLSSYKSGSGKIYQIAIPLSTAFSQLPEHAIFVAVFYQMLMQTEDKNSLYENIGSGEPIEIALYGSEALNNSDEVLHLSKGEQSWIPEIKRKRKNEFVLHNIQWPEEGIFQVSYNNNVVEQLAVNFDRVESDFSIWSTEELMQQIADNKLANFQILNTTTQQVSARIIQLDQGISLWKWFVFLAIIFIFAETMLLRLWK